MFRSKLINSLICGSLLLCSTAFALDTPKPGTPAPNFTLTSQSGSHVSLKDYKGKWIILFFSGRDQSGDVTLEARNFQRDLSKYTSFNAVVLGISPFSQESNKAWATSDELTFDLLSDTDQKIAQAYGVLLSSSTSVTDGGLSLMIIAPNGNIQLPVIVTNDVDGISGHMLACLQYFKDASEKTGE